MSSDLISKLTENVIKLITLFKESKANFIVVNQFLESLKEKDLALAISLNYAETRAAELATQVTNLQSQLAQALNSPVAALRELDDARLQIEADTAKIAYLTQAKEQSQANYEAAQANYEAQVATLTATLDTNQSEIEKLMDLVSEQLPVQSPPASETETPVEEPVAPAETPAETPEEVPVEISAIPVEEPVIAVEAPATAPSETSTTPIKTPAVDPAIDTPVPSAEGPVVDPLQAPELVSPPEAVSSTETPVLTNATEF